MKQTESLKKNNDFRMVYRRGKSYANKYLVLYKLKNKKETNRLGISVSKKVGNSVTRSRVTRLIKENYRLKEAFIESPGWDFVIIARSASNEADFYQISEAIEHLLLHQKVYNKE